MREPGPPTLGHASRLKTGRTASVLWISATRSGPAGSVSPRSWLEMQNIRPHTQTWWIKSSLMQSQEICMYIKVCASLLTVVPLAPSYSTDGSDASVLNRSSLAYAWLRRWCSAPSPTPHTDPLSSRCSQILSLHLLIVNLQFSRKPVNSRKSIVN